MGAVTSHRAQKFRPFPKIPVVSGDRVAYIHLLRVVCG